MKAKIKLKYRDGSEFNFEYSCDGSELDALVILRMVCRGVLMVSIASEVIATDEKGVELYWLTK